MAWSKNNLGIFVTGLVLGGLVVYILPTQGDISGVSNVSNTGEITRLKDVQSGEVVADDVLYTSDKYSFSLSYPKELIYKEFDEGSGATTIVFQEPGDAKVGFQLYITPYGKDTITGERILYDASGPVSDLKEEKLSNGLLVATFYSKAPILGETREIWWLHDGHLFELTTYASLDAWVREIISTLDFP